MRVLRELPFSDRLCMVRSPSGEVEVRPYQIVVWLSLGAASQAAPSLPPFPAILDTGHNHNFSIQADLLKAWAGWEPDELPKLKAISVNRQRVPLHSADV